MKVGDFLEWLAGAAFVVGTLLATHRAWTAVLVGALVLTYFAQCFSDHPVKVTRPRWLHRKKADS